MSNILGVVLLARAFALAAEARRCSTTATGNREDNNLPEHGFIGHPTQRRTHRVNSQ